MLLSPSAGSLLLLLSFLPSYEYFTIYSTNKYSLLNTFHSFSILMPNNSQLADCIASRSSFSAPQTHNSAEIQRSKLQRRQIGNSTKEMQDFAAAHYSHGIGRVSNVVIEHGQGPSTKQATNTRTALSLSRNSTFLLKIPSSTIT